MRTGGGWRGLGGEGGGRDKDIMHSGGGGGGVYTAVTGVRAFRVAGLCSRTRFDLCNLRAAAEATAASPPWPTHQTSISTHLATCAISTTKQNQDLSPRLINNVDTERAAAGGGEISVLFHHFLLQL